MSRARDVIKRLAHVDQVYEMANVPHRVYKLPIAQDIKFNVLQPGDKQIQHAPRVKVFRGNPETGPNFSIRLSAKESEIAYEVGTVFVTTKELALIIEHIKKYRAAYLKLWHDTGMDIDDLSNEMDAIDKP